MPSSLFEESTILPDVVIVNGPPGVGKSTVCGFLRALAPVTVLISGDALRTFAPPDARTHFGLGSTHRAAGALTATYLRMGAARVVFDHVFLGPDYLTYFRSAFSEPCQVHVFTLWASLETVIKRDRHRVERERLGEAVAECYLEIERNLAHTGQVIATEALSAEATAAAIHASVSSRTDKRPAV